MTRLFTALEIPASVRMALSLLKGGLPGARWIDADNYHVTLRFIGDIDGRTADEIAMRSTGSTARRSAQALGPRLFRDGTGAPFADPPGGAVAGAGRTPGRARAHHPAARLARGTAAFRAAPDVWRGSRAHRRGTSRAGSPSTAASAGRSSTSTASCSTRRATPSAADPIWSRKPTRSPPDDKPAKRNGPRDGGPSGQMASAAQLLAPEPPSLPPPVPVASLPGVVVEPVVSEPDAPAEPAAGLHGSAAPGALVSPAGSTPVVLVPRTGQSVRRRTSCPSGRTPGPPNRGRWRRKGRG